jgi:raffinose/stachyose/melibiose transport system substrate-binding protein
MYKKRIASLALTLVVLSSLVLASCGGGGEEATDTPGSAGGEQESATLLIWDQFTDPAWEETFESILADFRAQNPNVEITREPMTREQQLQTAKTALASGTGPDMIYMDTGPGNAGLLIEAGLLAPLDDVGAAYGWRDRFFPWAVERGSVDGKLYGLSLEMEFLGVYANKTLLEQEGLSIPETDQEVLTFCAKAKDLGYIPFVWSNNPGWQSFHQFGMVANNALGSKDMAALLIDKQGSWTQDKILNALKFYFVDMRDAGCFTDDVNALGYDDANSLFYTGKALLNPTGTWLVNDIATNMQEGFEVEMVPFPSIDGGERVLPGGLGSAWFISANTDYPDAAAMLLDHFYKPESIRKWVEGVNVVPPLEFNAEDFQLNPLLEFAIATAQAGGKGEAGSNLGDYIDTNAPDSFNEMMQDGFQAVVAGLKTPEEQLDDLQAEWEAGLE